MATAQDVLNIAAEEIGYIEQSGNRTKYGQAYKMDGVYWCMIFQWWCFQQVDKNLFFGGGKCASCSKLMEYAKRNGQWVTKDYQPGDLVIFDFPGNNVKTDHVGIVEKQEGKTLYTIEGNTSSGAGSQDNGDGVFEKKRNVSLAIGAYRPKYEEEEMTYEDWKKYMDQYRTEMGKKTVGKWYKEAWENLKKKGVTDGTRPGDLITREEAATMIDRATK